MEFENNGAGKRKMRETKKNALSKQKATCFHERRTLRKRLCSNAVLKESYQRLLLYLKNAYWYLKCITRPWRNSERKLVNTCLGCVNVFLLIIDGDENLSHNNNFVFTQKANQCRLSLSSHLTGSY